ncbi:MAG: dihydropteroate synthase [Deltaproteobacteria bacterium]|nr:dihydropteroate synthase [Deltaproteobacteria bacterium]
MGILNVTPDSFSGDGIDSDPQRAVAYGQKLVEEGADILDVGGESTRPGAKAISEEEEIRRVIPVVEALARSCPIPLSVDTRKAAVARKALEAGAEIVNDVSGLRYDPQMLSLIRKAPCYFVLMHSRGTPETMRSEACYSSVVQEVYQFFTDSLQRLEEAGVGRERIWLDPGLGFAKRLEHNLELLDGLDRFISLGYPLLVGPSRKSFIGEILKSENENRLEGTLAAVAISVYKGAQIVRVHDVAATKRFLTVFEAILKRAVHV